MSRRTRIRLALALALIAIGVAAHGAFWYLPRARAATPELPEARALLAQSGADRDRADERWDAVLWLAYPHQNLGLLERRVGDADAWLETITGSDGEDRGADRAASALPRFGPFRVPPARELLIAMRRDGAIRATVDVYPLVTALARAAGTVAGNPWLAGGDVGDDGDGGESGRVSWRGTVWSYEAGARDQEPRDQDQDQDQDETLSAKERRLPPAGLGEGVATAVPAPPQAAPASSFPSMEAFAFLRLLEGIEPLPPALYRIVPIEDEDQARFGQLALLAGSPPAESRIPPALLAGAAGFAAPAGWIAQSVAPALAGAPGGVRGFAVWNEGSDVSGLPLLATLRRGAVERLDLPGEGLLKLVGREVPQATVAGFEVRALESAGVTSGGAVAERLAPLFDHGGEALGAVRSDDLEPLLRQIAGYLALVPFVDPKERRRFERWAELVVPLRGCGASTLEVGPYGNWVRILPCVAVSPAPTVLRGGQSD